jgi:hypothetical protein
VIFFEAPNPEEDRGAGAAVPVMLGQMQYAAVARNLHVKRGVLIEAVLPIDFEAEEIDVKLFCLFDAEDAENRNGLEELSSMVAVKNNRISFPGGAWERMFARLCLAS